MNRNLLSALSLEKTVMIMVFSLIVIIAGFVVWVTLNMLVREKIKDIGIMRAMGFSKKYYENISYSRNDIRIYWNSNREQQYL